MGFVLSRIEESLNFVVGRSFNEILKENIKLREQRIELERLKATATSNSF